MGCTVQKGSQSARQSKSSTRDRSKSVRCCSPLLTNNSSNCIKKKTDLVEKQNQQKITLDLKQSIQQEVNQMLMGMTPQSGKKNIKTISKHLKWQSVDNIMESDQSIQFYNGVTKQRIFNQDDCLTLNNEKIKQDT